MLDEEPETSKWDHERAVAESETNDGELEIKTKPLVIINKFALSLQVLLKLQLIHNLEE